jgi:hypothetical protein
LIYLFWDFIYSLTEVEIFSCWKVPEKLVSLTGNEGDLLQKGLLLLKGVKPMTSTDPL